MYSFWARLSVTARRLFFVLIFLVFSFFVFVVLVIFFDFFAHDRVSLIVIILIFVVGNYDEMDWMRLRDFEFRVTFGAGDNFSFFHFIFVEVKFGFAFGTSGHGGFLLTGSMTEQKLLYNASVGLSRNGNLWSDAEL